MRQSPAAIGEIDGTESRCRMARQGEGREQTMTQRTTQRPSLSRRSLLAGAAALGGAAVLVGRGASAQQSAKLGIPPSVITDPPRNWGPGNPSIYPDPDVIVVDPSFEG